MCVDGHSRQGCLRSFQLTATLPVYTRPACRIRGNLLHAHKGHTASGLKRRVEAWVEAARPAGGATLFILSLVTDQERPGWPSDSVNGRVNWRVALDPSHTLHCTKWCRSHIMAHPWALFYTSHQMQCTERASSNSVSEGPDATV